MAVHGANQWLSIITLKESLYSRLFRSLYPCLSLTQSVAFEHSITLESEVMQDFIKFGGHLVLFKVQYCVLHPWKSTAVVLVITLL